MTLVNHHHVSDRCRMTDDGYHSTSGRTPSVTMSESLLIDSIRLCSIMLKHMYYHQCSIPTHTVPFVDTWPMRQTTNFATNACR